MESDEKYYYTACREMTIDHDTGVLCYSSSYLSVPVAQFIGPKPFSGTFTKFGIVIMKQRENAAISIGICPKAYPSNKKPGFGADSIGYRAKDGNIHLNTGFLYKAKGGSCEVGDTIECEFVVKENRVRFYKNGEQVFQREQLYFESTKCFPIVSMQCKGESVKLLHREAWVPLRFLETPKKPKVKRSTICNEMTLYPETGVLRYTSLDPSKPVGQFIGSRPFSETFKRLSIVIRSCGTNGAISVGICPCTYPEKRHPGWEKRSFGYHADDGGIYSEYKFIAKGTPCTVGDTMECELLSKNSMLTFYRNQEVVYRTKIKFQHTACFPIIGMESIGESVKLSEQEPWRPIRSDVHSVFLDHFDSYIKDNILLSPKDELRFVLSGKHEYTGVMFVQNTGLRSVLFKILNEDVPEPVSVIEPGMTKTIHVSCQAGKVPDTISVEWLTVEFMDVNSHPSIMNALLKKYANNTGHYQWRVRRHGEKTLKQVSGEYIQEIHPEGPQQCDTDSSKMSSETSMEAQVARVPDEWDECNICESNDNIVSKCMECNDILCQICENKHKKGKKSKFHTLLPFAERKNEQEYKKLLFCAVHGFEEFIRYCTKCDTLVCTDCMQGDHAGHPLSKIDVIAKDKRKQLAAVHQKMTDYCSSLSDTRMQEYKELVIQRANHFVDLIRAKEKKILTARENKKAEIEPFLEAYHSSYQITKSAIRSYSNVRLLADNTLRDLLTKLVDIKTPKKLTEEDVDEMFMKDFP